MDKPIIQLKNLSKRYRDFTAVDQLNLRVEEGEIFGLLGPNGAGKSTTILMMLGLTDPSGGSVEVCGINSTQRPIEVKRRVGYLPEDVGFYDDLTGIENLIYTARLNGLSKEEACHRANALLRRVGLDKSKDKKVGKYSKGMRQRLGLADVLIKDPEVIILDEPTTGIDPKGVQELLDLIVELRNEKKISVLFSSHNLHQVQQVCDKVGIFVNGRLLAAGDIQSLSKQLFSKEKYQIQFGLESAKKDSKTVDSIQQLFEAELGLQSIDYDNGVFRLECSEDLSSKVSKTLVNAGYELNYLAKKEYGLDAIYHRYFEGGGDHVKS